MPSLKQIFSSALEVSDDHLPAFLSRTCGGDTTLESEVLSLLKAHRQPVRFLDPEETTSTSRPAGVPWAGRLERVQWIVLDEQPGAVIDRYKLLEVIGQGGHGLVFRAQQEEPIRRQVALKVIRKGLETEAMRLRFEAERQTLALLDHPNISKLFDAGATAQRRSYFVMELVPGTPINEYCDEHRLPLRARVELFIHVCRAVHHAHQKGIIHRDLKPSNVLVSDVDGVPSPKVIDFGVSRVTATGSTSTDLEILGTPQYMSPEQLASDQSGVDIRTDVYALGAMLYELLGGVRALDLQGKKVRTIQEVAVFFASEPTVAPSRRLMMPGSSAQGAEIARTRRTNLTQLCRSLRRELDWIVLKAIARDRSNRYDSVAALADDLQRYLEKRPVLASPEGALYAFGLFYRRNKTAMLFSTALAVSLLVTLFVVSSLLVRTRRVRDRAIAEEQAKIKQLRESYFQQAAATMRSHAQGQRLKAFEAIRAAAQISPSIELRNQAIACMSIPDVELAGTVQLPQSVGAVAFTRNGERYAYVGTDNLIHVMRTADRGQILQISPFGKKPVDARLFSPDGRYLAYCWAQYIPSGTQAISKRGYELWDLQRNRPVASQILVWPPGDFNCRSDQWATTDEAAKTVLIYELPSWRLLKTISAAGNLREVIYSPAGDRIAIACNDDCTLRILDVATGSTIKIIPTGFGMIWGIRWSPNGRSVSVTGDNMMSQVQVYDVRTGTLETTMNGALGTELGNAFCPDGRFLLTGGWDQKVRLWDAHHGSEILDIPRQGDGVFFQDSTHFSNPIELGLENWNLITGRECRTYTGLMPEVNTLNSVISPGGKLLAAGMGVGVRVWDLQTEKTYAFVGADSVLSVAFSPDGSTLYASVPGQVLHWNVAEIAGREEEPQGYAANVWRTVAMGLSRDGHTMVWGTDPGNLFVGDPTLGNWTRLIGPQERCRRFLAVSPDGKWATTSPRYADHFEVWDLINHELTATIAITSTGGDLGPVAFSPDGKLLVVDQGGTDRWFRVGDWKLLYSADRNPAKAGVLPPATIALSPDGKLIASGRGTATMLEDAATHEPLATFETPATPQTVSSVAFSPDSTKLMVTGGGEVTVWDLPLVRKELSAIGLDWH
jgi:serine/threonine protein kinase/WD40 repeat protein